MQSKLVFSSFQIFNVVSYRWNFYYYWPTFLSESIDLNCVSSKRLAKFLDISVFIWYHLESAEKSSKECTLNYLWQGLSFIYSVYYIPIFYFCWLSLLLEQIHMRCAYYATLTKPLEIRVCIYDMVMVTKSFKHCTWNHFWKVSRLFTQFAKIETFTSTGDRSIGIDSYEMCLFFQSDQVLRNKCLYF